MHGQDSRTVTVRLPDEVYEKLEAEAKKEEKSIGLWIKKWLFELAEYEEPINLDEAIAF